jgi:hypothetical protein
VSIYEDAVAILSADERAELDREIREYERQAEFGFVGSTRSPICEHDVFRRACRVCTATTQRRG